jgi:mono/diheme cytochrome c family protein
MHGWGDRLSEQELWDVLSYIRTLAPFNPLA